MYSRLSQAWKFNPSSSKHRPILVKFLRIFDGALERGSLPFPIIIKPDLTREERAIDSAFLKTRWNLIQNGTDKKCIRLRGNNIYINKTLYARFDKSINGSFVTNIIDINQSTSNSQHTTHNASWQDVFIPSTNQTTSTPNLTNPEPMITSESSTPKENQRLASVLYINTRSIVNKLDLFQWFVYTILLQCLKLGLPMRFTTMKFFPVTIQFIVMIDHPVVVEWCLLFKVISHVKFWNHLLILKSFVLNWAYNTNYLLCDLYSS